MKNYENYKKDEETMGRYSSKEHIPYLSRTWRIKRSIDYCIQELRDKANLNRKGGKRLKSQHK